MAKAKIKVIQNQDKPIPTEVMAENIRSISEGLRRVLSGQLNEKAIVLLISWSSQVSQAQVKKVLEAMAQLESTYLKKDKR